MRLDLLRHGEVAGGRRLRGARDDDPLTAEGHARTAAAIAEHGPWDRIVTSPLARCRAPAEEAVARGQGVLHVDERLAEYDFGDWSGRDLGALWAEAGNALAAFLADPDSHTPRNGETGDAFRARVRAAWRSLAASDAGESVLVLAHGGVLRQMLGDALGLAPPLHPKLEWPPAALSRLKLFEAGAVPTLGFHAKKSGVGTA